MPVIDLYQELRALLTVLNSEAVDYALCGGLALAVYAEPRATKDIDLMIHRDDLPRVRTLLRALGFKLEAAPLEFSSGFAVRRISKIEQNEVFTLDLVLVAPVIEEIWTTRCQLTWGDQPLWVVSRAGLIAMKRMAGRPQDLADIHSLGGDDD